MKITDSALRDRIYEAIGDPDSPKILHSIRSLPKNAQSISEETGIPLSSAYRKLATLRGAGLAYVKSFEVTLEGKRQELYMASVLEVRIGIMGDQLEIELVPTNESVTRLWFKLFGG